MEVYRAEFEYVVVVDLEKSASEFIFCEPDVDAVETFGVLDLEFAVVYDPHSHVLPAQHFVVFNAQFAGCIFTDFNLIVLN